MFGKNRTNNVGATSIASSNTGISSSMVFKENDSLNTKGVQTRNMAARTALKDLSNNAPSNTLLKAKSIVQSNNVPVLTQQSNQQNQQNLRRVQTFTTIPAAQKEKEKAYLKEKELQEKAFQESLLRRQQIVEDIDLDDISDEDEIDEEEEEVTAEDELEQEQQSIEEMEEFGGGDAMDVESDDDQALNDRQLKKMKLNKEINDSVEDIDIHDRDDPQFCTEYVEYIFEYLRQVEQDIRVDSNYMERQVDINEKHRGILIDWLVDVSIKFKLLQETLFLAVNIIDRYLMKKSVARNKLQLVGVSALLIACKYEEICTPKVDDFVVISARTFTQEEVLTMERGILQTLNFNLNSATPLYFLRRFSKAGHSDSKIHTVAKYIIELSMLDYQMLNYLPSQIAASAVYIARRMNSRLPVWNSTLGYYTDYSEKELVPCIRDLNGLVKKQENESKFRAIYTKYSSHAFMQVALMKTVDL